MTDQGELASELRKIANLLAVQQVKGLKKGEAAVLLSTAGFTNREIAVLVGTSEGSVRGFLSAARNRDTDP